MISCLSDSWFGFQLNPWIHEGRCMRGFFSCPNMCPNICIEQKKNCNKVADCPDKMDEFYKCRKSETCENWIHLSLQSLLTLGDPPNAC